MTGHQQEEAPLLTLSKKLEQLMEKGPLAAYTRDRTNEPTTQRVKQAILHDLFILQALLASLGSGLSVAFYWPSAMAAIRKICGDDFHLPESAVNDLATTFAVSGVTLNVFLGIEAFLVLFNRLVERIQSCRKASPKKGLESAHPGSGFKNFVLGTFAAIPAFFISRVHLPEMWAWLIAAANVPINALGAEGIGFPASLMPRCVSPNVTQKAQSVLADYLKQQIQTALACETAQLDEKLRKLFREQKHFDASDFLLRFLQLGDEHVDQQDAAEGSGPAKQAGAASSVDVPAVAKKVENFYVTIRHEPEKSRKRKLATFLTSLLATFGVSGYALGSFFEIFDLIPGVEAGKWVGAIFATVLTAYVQAGLGYSAAQSVGKDAFSGNKKLVDHIIGTHASRAIAFLFFGIGFFSGGTLGGANVDNFLKLVSSSSILAYTFGSLGETSAWITNAFFSHKLMEKILVAMASIFGKPETRQRVDTIQALEKLAELFSSMTPQAFETCLLDFCNDNLELSAKLLALFQTRLSFVDYDSFLKTPLGQRLGSFGVVSLQAPIIEEVPASSSVSSQQSSPQSALSVWRHSLGQGANFIFSVLRRSQERDRESGTDRRILNNMV